MPSNQIHIGGTSTNWATGSNWLSTSAPATGDSATLDHNSTGAFGIAGSDQGATDLAALYITSNYLKQFGDNGTPLQIDAVIAEIGRSGGGSQPGQHSGRINVKFRDLASIITVFGTAAAATDAGKEPVRIQTPNVAGSKLIVPGSGRIGVATDTALDTARFDEIALLGSATINVAAGTTLTKWRQEGGTGNLFCAGTTLQQDGGIVNLFGGGAWTTIYAGGSVNLQTSGTVTTLEILPTGIVNMLGDSRTRTVTTVKLYKGATFSYDPNVVTITNPIQLIQCSLEDVKIITPRGLTVAIVKT